MAISQMKKVALLFPKDKMDAVLELLQQSETVHIRHLSQLEDWQEAFANQKVATPQLKEEAVSEANGTISNLMRRQQELEVAINQLSHYLPKLGLIASMKQEPFSVDYEELMSKKRSQQSQSLLKEVNESLAHLQSLNQEIEETQAKVAELEKWRPLQVLPQELETFEFLTAKVGTIPKTAGNHAYQELLDNPLVQVEEIFQSNLEYGLVLYMDSRLDLALENYQFTEFEGTGDMLPAQALDKMQAQVENWKSEKEDLLATLKQSGEKLKQLQLETDYVIGLYERESAKESLAMTEHLGVLEGWVEESQYPRLQALVSQAFGDNLLLQAADVEQEDWDQVPIKLHNHPLIAPFEMITEMYALPKYKEKDPTPFLAPFYFVFFGMMVADIGYGLVLFLATFWALKALHLSASSKRFVTLFNILGVSVTLWGLVYGSLFGYELPIKLLSTSTDIMSILILSVAFGFFTVWIGLLLGGIQQVRVRDYAEAYNSGFAWCLILIGILLLALGNLVPGLAILAPLGQWMAILNAIGIIVVSIVQSKSIAGLGSALFNLYNISSYAGDLVSFTRLMALGMAGASIGSAFNLIVGIFPLPARLTIGVVLFIVLHIVNFLLSLLSGYVHGARLIFVEFFGKFYEGGGKAFKPLKAAEKYALINRKNQSEDN